MSEDGAPEFWQIRFPVPVDAVDDVLMAVDDEVESLAAYENDDGSWYCELLTRVRPEKARLKRALAQVLGTRTPNAREIRIEALAARDWLEATRRSFPPREIARFWVHGSHVEDDPPPRSVPLKIDAGTAFGSGEHGSTMGCLMAIDDLARMRRFERVLDMGCGSAILAIAALKCWPTARGYATDIDPGSVAAAAANAMENGVGARLVTVVADGYERSVLRRAERFDLVLANILAGPLMEMAPDLAHTLTVRGHAVVAGLLSAQADAVVLAHRRQGLKPVARYDVGPWSTLVFTKLRARKTRPLIRYPSPFAVERWPMGPS